MSDNKINPIIFEMPKNKYNAIKVIGVGGGGSNAVNYMYHQDIKGVDFVICNTDAQALENSPIPNKIQLGAGLTEGMGAGANPEIGAKAAEESYETLKELLSTNTKMVFITAGMGGGTGTGAAPIIAKIAKELGLLTVGIVTMPFEFEGKSRNQQAQKGIASFRENVDSLIVINNNKLRDVYGNLGYKSGFAKADEVLSTAARGIVEVITHHYKQNIDLNDAKTVLSNSGTAIMGSSQAIGDERARRAIEGALDSPLLNDNRITGAKNVLLLIVSGTNEITIDEIGEISDHIRNEAGHNINIIMGIGDDESIGEAISVTIIATGFSSSQQNEITDTESKKITHILDDDVKGPQFDLFDKQEDELKSPLGDTSNDVVEDRIIHKLEGEESLELTPITEHIENIDVDYDKIKTESKKDLLFDLEEGITEVTELFEIIPTTDLIRNIEVTFDEIVADIADDDEYIINVAEKKDIIEEGQNEEELKYLEQMKLTFEFPVNEDADKTESPENASPEKDFDTNQIIPDFSNVTTHNLGDFEEETTSTQKKQVAEVITEEDADLQFELKIVGEEENSTKKKRIENKDDTLTKETLSPLNTSIEEFRKTTDDRKMHLKKHNYTFHTNPSNIDEIEKEPAYKRQKIELDENPSSSENFQSRTTIETDENDSLQLRSNNSFLHDNVD